MNLSDSLAFACAHHFLQVHPVLTGLTRQVEFTHTKIKEKASTTNSNENNHQGLSTWVAEGACWFTLVKHLQTTIVFSHDTLMMYYGTPDVQLHRDLPDGHAFLAQTALDEGKTPRLLIVDLVLPVLSDPQERGETLRRLGRFFPVSCHIQWKGDISSLRRFVKDNNTLPHKVQGLVTWEGEGKDPFKMIYEKLEA